MEKLTVALAQIAPVWLDREQTIARVVVKIREAAAADCRLVVFGEALVPGYPFWVEWTDGARFESRVQKEIFAHYAAEAVVIEQGHLDAVRAAAVETQTTVYLGCIERPPDRGGHSLYCSLVYIDARGEIASVHRKLVPTYEERLVWSPGDGHGLRVHKLGAFTLGGLNCWENWMPLARAALYAQGEDLHIAVWPGSERNTRDITRFIARESRSYVISVSGLLTRDVIPSGTPHRELMQENFPETPANGGSCIAGPDGEWVIEPAISEEKLLVATIDHRRVREERQNFDPAGHYSRPDVMQLKVKAKRQGVLIFDDEPGC
jgi:nitrilase